MNTPDLLREMSIEKSENCLKQLPLCPSLRVNLNHHNFTHPPGNPYPAWVAAVTPLGPIFLFGGASMESAPILLMQFNLFRYNRSIQPISALWNDLDLSHKASRLFCSVA